MYLYLLDTNIISDLIKNPQGDLAKIVSELEPNSFCTSIIVACELSYGVKKKDSIQLAKKVEILLSTLDGRWCINNQKVILPLSPFLLRRSCPYPDGNRHAEIGHDIHGSDAGMNLDDLGLENTGSQLIAK